MVARISQHQHAIKMLELITKLQTEHSHYTEWLHAEAIKPYTMRFLFETEQSAIDRLDRLNIRINRIKRWYYELIIEMLVQDELD